MPPFFGASSKNPLFCKSGLPALVATNCCQPAELPQLIPCCGGATFGLRPQDTPAGAGLGSGVFYPGTGATGACYIIGAPAADLTPTSSIATPITGGNGCQSSDCIPCLACTKFQSYPPSRLTLSLSTPPVTQNFCVDGFSEYNVPSLECGTTVSLAGTYTLRLTTAEVAAYEGTEYDFCVYTTAPVISYATVTTAFETRDCYLVAGTASITLSIGRNFTGASVAFWSIVIVTGNASGTGVLPLSWSGTAYVGSGSAFNCVQVAGFLSGGWSAVVTE